MPRFTRHCTTAVGDDMLTEFTRRDLMFTGIVTALGTVRRIDPIGAGRDMRLVIGTPAAFLADPPVALGASIACSGCCLTAVEVGADWFAVDASAETLAHTTLGTWSVGRRSTSNARCGSATNWAAISSPAMSTASAKPCRPRRKMARRAGCSGCPSTLARFIAAKGSVAVDGVSLTVNEVQGDTFGVNIIPHTAVGHQLRHHAAGRQGEHRDRHAGALRRPAARRRALMENLHASLVTPNCRSTSPRAEELIEEARNGRMFILVDDEDRENEGDLVIPAQFATPDAINFMARHARGLICLALTRAARREAGPAADEPAERHAAPDRLHRLDRGARGRHHRHLRRRPRAAPSPWRSTPTARATTSPRPAMSSRWWRARAARWCAPAIPRPRSTSPARPG